MVIQTNNYYLGRDDNKVRWNQFNDTRIVAMQVVTSMIDGAEPVRARVRFKRVHVPEVLHVFLD